MACVGNDSASPSGKRCIVTSNSKTKMVNLAAAIRDEFPQTKTIVITSDTRVNEAEVRQFIASPAKSAEAYDAVFASPSIGTEKARGAPYPVDGELAALSRHAAWFTFGKYAAVSN